MKHRTLRSIAAALLAAFFFFAVLLFPVYRSLPASFPAQALLSLAFPAAEAPPAAPVRLLCAAFPALSGRTRAPDTVAEAPSAAPAPSPSEIPVREMTVTRSGDADGTEGIFINNNTAKSADISALLAMPSAVRVPPEGPTVLILHTHTSEAYTPTEKMHYVPTDTDRTEDPAFNVVRVGEELKAVLESAGIAVIHDPTVNDYPSYNGSYQKSYRRLTELLTAYPSVSVVIDLHRDALLYEDGSKMKVVWDSPEGKAAQCMLVVGTDERLEHPDWQQNLSFALKLQAEMVRSFPGLARPVNLAKHRYNQQVSHGALILEMGASGNTLEEALLGVRYVGECLSRVILAENEKNT